MKPDLMLFDEVTASLDPEMVRGVLEILLGLARGNMTMIVVTHEMEFARRVADTVLFLDGGKILEATPGKNSSAGRGVNEPAASWTAWLR